MSEALQVIGSKSVPVKRIPVTVAENEQDYEFVFINVGNGRRMTVF